jgi:hypothetical protein
MTTDEFQVEREKAFQLGFSRGIQAGYVAAKCEKHEWNAATGLCNNCFVNKFALQNALKINR